MNSYLGSRPRWYKRHRLRRERLGDARDVNGTPQNTFNLSQELHKAERVASQEVKIALNRSGRTRQPPGMIRSRPLGENWRFIMADRDTGNRRRTSSHELPAFRQ